MIDAEELKVMATGLRQQRRMLELGEAAYNKIMNARTPSEWANLVKGCIDDCPERHLVYSKVFFSFGCNDDVKCCDGDDPEYEELRARWAEFRAAFVDDRLKRGFKYDNKKILRALRDVGFLNAHTVMKRAIPEG